MGSWFADSARRDRLLHAAEQGFRLALPSLRFDGGDCRAAGGQQILKLASSGEPHRQQWIDSSGKLWLTTLLQRSVTQLCGQRLLAIFVPDRSEPRRWMDDKRLHVASLGELFKAHELREGKRFEARYEERLVVGLVAHALAKRRGKMILPEPFSHGPPHAKLPFVGLTQRRGHRHVVFLLVVGRRGEHGVSQLPFADHPRPANVVFVEQAGNPPGREQRLPRDVERYFQSLRGVRRDHVEHGERQPVKRPRVGRGCVARRLQQRHDRAGKRNVDVGHDAVAEGPLVVVPGTEFLGQLSREPRLGSRMRHHNSLLREEIDGGSGEEVGGRFHDLRKTLNEVDGKGHGKA